MTNHTYNYKYIIASIFLILLFLTFIKSDSYNQLDNIFNYLSTDKNIESNYVSIETEYSNKLWHKEDLLNLNGYMAKALHMKGFYNDLGLYISDNNYIITPSNITTTEYEYDQTYSFYNFLKSNHINFLYVNEPTKYLNDSIFTKKFGIDTYSNRNMDLYLSLLSDKNIPFLDLRQNIISEGLDIEDLFYRTDHHWTTEAGLWATNIIADGLNKYCNYSIDSSIYDLKKYNIKKWNSCWLGEQGRKISEAYVGLDDYTELKPKFATSFTFKNDDNSTYTGTFDDFINEDVYNTSNNVYQNESWHYAYSPINCINNNISDGKILILGDSYDHVTQPFLALGIHEVDFLILRCFDNNFDLRKYILDNNYDTVVVTYAQFMLGAHDDPSSANYRMYNFE